MIILGPFLIIFIIPCYRRNVLIGLTITSNGIKTTPSIKNIKAKFNSVRSFFFQPVFMDDIKTVIRDKSVGGEKNKSVGGEKPVQILKESNDPLDKSNYRSISILPLISKVYERLIYNQLSEYTESFLSHILCGFRKAHSIQHALFKLNQSWQKELENGCFVGAVPMDLSKAYDCIPHQLLIAKLKFYGTENGSL